MCETQDPGRAREVLDVIAPVTRVFSAALSLSRAREYVIQLTLVFPVIEVGPRASF